MALSRRMGKERPNSPTQEEERSRTKKEGRGKAEDYLKQLHEASHRQRVNPEEELNKLSLKK